MTVSFWLSLERFTGRRLFSTSTELSNCVSPPAEPGVYDFNYLVRYFSADRPLASITPADADEYRRWLLKPQPKRRSKSGKETGEMRLSENTVRRYCGRAKQFFRYAVRKRLIADSPFADMGETNVRANKSREHFITRDVADAVLKACPDSQWKLLFALSHYAGLRCPSEHLGLRLIGRPAGSLCARQRRSTTKAKSFVSLRCFQSCGRTSKLSATK
jgi:hypothetical protein